jgi:hypothetical protein
MATELIDRLAIFVACRIFSCTCVVKSRSLSFDSYVRMQHFVRRTTYVPFRRFGGDVQRFYAALHGTLGSYLLDVLQEGNVDAVACLPVPQAQQIFSSSLLFTWWSTLLLLVRNNYSAPENTTYKNFLPEFGFPASPISRGRKKVKGYIYIYIYILVATLIKV